MGMMVIGYRRVTILVREIGHKNAFPSILLVERRTLGVGVGNAEVVMLQLVLLT